MGGEIAEETETHRTDGSKWMGPGKTINPKYGYSDDDDGVKKNFAKMIKSIKESKNNPNSILGISFIYNIVYRSKFINDGKKFK